MMKQFDFTLKGFLDLLNTEGINSKGILKQAFNEAKTSDLLVFRNSINEEIRIRELKGGANSVNRGTNKGS